MSDPPPDDHDVTTIGLKRGQKLSDQYVLVRIIGQGAMGVVWLAEDTLLASRKVAIKTIPPVLCRDKRAMADLIAEATHLDKLSHPNIVRLRTIAQDPSRAGMVYMVLDYVEGETLNDLLAVNRTGLPLDRVRRWAMHLAAALDHAHEQRVLHRDIKPSNVMIGTDDTAYLMDFSIARAAKDTYTRVTGIASSGTLHYMSPQQLEGKESPSNDVYSLSALLYEALSGKPPFSTGSIAHQILHVVPEPIASIPSEVNDALLAGLAKRTQDRPATATDLGRRLSPRPPLNDALVYAERHAAIEHVVGHAQGKTSDPLARAAKDTHVTAATTTTLLQSDHRSGWGKFFGRAASGLISALLTVAISYPWLVVIVRALESFQAFIKHITTERVASPESLGISPPTMDMNSSIMELQFGILAYSVIVSSLGLGFIARWYTDRKKSRVENDDSLFRWNGCGMRLLRHAFVCTVSSSAWAIACWWILGFNTVLEGLNVAVLTSEWKAMARFSSVGRITFEEITESHRRLVDLPWLFLPSIIFTCPAAYGAGLFIESAWRWVKKVW